MNGATPVSGMRLVLLDFTGGDLDSLLPSQPVHADVAADGGTISHVTVQRIPESGVWRVTMEVKPRVTSRSICVVTSIYMAKP